MIKYLTVSHATEGPARVGGREIFVAGNKLYDEADCKGELGRNHYDNIAITKLFA